jgi:acetoacetate decarboxylase
MIERTSDGPIWIGARVLTAEIPIDREAAEAVLPPGLTLTDPPTATVFVANYPATTFGSVYREAGLFLHANDARGLALHCPWMVVDDDTALILGRELLGMPKKMADITLDEHGDQVTGVVRRKGAEILRIEVGLEAADLDPPPLFGRRMVNLFGSIVDGMSLLDLPSSAETIHAARRGRGSVRLSSNGRDRLEELAGAVEVDVRFLVMDFGSSQGGQPEILGAVDPAWSMTQFFARAM